MASPLVSRMLTRWRGCRSRRTGYIFCAKLLLAWRSSSTTVSHGIAFSSSMSCTHHMQ